MPKSVRVTNKAISKLHSMATMPSTRGQPVYRKTASTAHATAQCHV